MLRSFARENWFVLAIFLGATLFAVGWTLAFGSSPFVNGLVIGVIATALAASFVMFFLVLTGGALTVLGSWAEDVTNDAVKRAAKRGHVWGAVPNVEVGGFDIDHVVVAPGGVIAIETKAHVTGIDAGRARADVTQAREAARKATAILRSKDVAMPSDVVSVLAVWGSKATRTIPAEGRLVDGVHVIAVHDLADWLARFKVGRVAEDNAADLLERLRRFKDSQIRRPPTAI
jgi:hypothetical protein